MVGRTAAGTSAWNPAPAARAGIVRGAAGLAALLLGLGAIGYYRGWPLAHDLWPVPDQAMTFRWFASYLAAFAASLGWVALTGELAALASIALTVTAGSVAMAPYFGVLAIDGAGGGYALVAIAFAALLVVGVATFRWARHLPERQAFRQPGGVRWAFVLFVALLLLAGGLAATRATQIFPWVMAPRWLTIVGLLLLSSAVYFGYGWWRGSWAQAGSQLAGFLVYDLVLALPYGRMILERNDPAAPVVPGSYGSSGNEVDGTRLAIVVAVVAVSAVIAAWYLLLDPRTRLLAQRPWIRPD